MAKSFPTRWTRGFTLIEMIVVIVITGILAGIVAVFIRSPVESYVNASRRAELTDIADTAVRRIARDVRLALPNSLRNPQDGSTACVEFIPTRIGGRYRNALTAAGAGDMLDFTAVDGSFEMLALNGNLPATSRIVANDIVVVYNTESCDAATCTGNAYQGRNAIQVAAVTAPGATPDTTAITFVGAGAAAPFNRKQLPSASPFFRFQVIPNNEHVVSYACTGVTLAGGGTLSRFTRTLAAAWLNPASCAAMTTGATAAVLANNVSACTLRYEPPGSSTGLGNNGILAISLQITQAGENVALYHQVHVDNSP
ncbi:MAG TPA: type II secretion system protein [Rhodocyclaceae bacterium]|nr:type II secretion system protein [Rhodocyclaceae bacterium]